MPLLVTILNALRECPFRRAASLLFLASLLGAAAGAQDANDYVLVPGSSQLLPQGESLSLAIQWIGLDGTPHAGVYGGVNSRVPEWTVNGKPLDRQDPAEGRLTVDLSLERATYRAPGGLPPVNPVTVAVRFQSSDTSRSLVILVCEIQVVQPANQWYVTFSFHGSQLSEDRSATEEHHYQRREAGSGSLLIRGAPPERDGSVSLNTEYDSIVASRASGSWAERIEDVTRDLNGAIEEKTIRNHRGNAHPQPNGIAFSYDPSPGGIRGLAGAGLGFDKRGQDQFFTRDDHNQWVETDETVEEPEGHRVLLGRSADQVTRTRNGFQIDFRQTRDTTYTDERGMRHEEHSELEYHVTISRGKANPTGRAEGRQDRSYYYAILHKKDAVTE